MYGDFLTMAAIACTRSVGIVAGNNFKIPVPQRGPARNLLTFFGCLLIWLFSFAIISPAIFHFKIGGFSFGSFGWDVRNGRCELVDCKEKGMTGGGVIYIYGVIIPFLILIGSYLTLGLFVKREMKEIHEGLGQTDIQVSENLLSYNIFAFRLTLHGSS